MEVMQPVSGESGSVLLRVRVEVYGIDEKGVIRTKLGDGSDSRGPLSQGPATNPHLKLLENTYISLGSGSKLRAMTQT